jgi:hypothetical protein
MKIKAFVDMTLAPTIRDGVLQLMRLSGLGIVESDTNILSKFSSPRGRRPLAFLVLNKTSICTLHPQAEKNS